MKAYSKQIAADDNTQYYWQELGLHHDPFAKGNHHVFKVNEWENYHELLAHLSKHSQVLKLVFGEKGIGKTSFIEQFNQNTQGYFAMSVLQANASWNIEKFIYAVNTGIGFAQNETFNQSLEMINAHLPSGDFNYVITIDNAELLSDEILILLKEWSKKSHETTRLKFILVADTSLLHRLRLLMTPLENERLLHTFELKPIDLEQTNAYLEHCLVMAGFEGDFLFSQNDVKKIYRISKGVFSKINKAARRVLIDQLIKGNGINSIIQENRKSFVFGGMLLILVAAFLLSKQPDLSLNEPHELLLPQNQQKFSQKTEQGNDDLLAADLSALDEFEKAEGNPFLEDTILDGFEKKKKVALQEDEIIQSLTDDMDFITDKLPAKKKQKKEDKPAITKFSDPKLITRNVNPEHKSVIKEREKLIMQEPGQNYTIQLMAGNTPYSVINFIKNNKLEASANYYISRQPDITWYSVIYGTYNTRDAARVAVTKLPFKIRKNNVWIRRYSEIQKIIIANQDAK